MVKARGKNNENCCSGFVKPKANSRQNKTNPKKYNFDSLANRNYFTVIIKKTYWGYDFIYMRGTLQC